MEREGRKRKKERRAPLPFHNPLPGGEKKERKGKKKNSPYAPG